MATVSDRTLQVCILGLSLLWAGADALAQESVASQVSELSALSESPEVGQASGWFVKPSVQFKGSSTNNALLTQNNTQSDQIAEMTPGVQVDANTPRIKAHFNYQLQALAYVQGSRQSQAQHALNTFGNIQLIDRQFFLDFSGSIAHQAISAFGIQSAGTSNTNPNRAETSNFRVSPYLRGRFLGTSEYELRYAQSVMGSNSAQVANVHSSEAKAQLKDLVVRPLGWSLDASQQIDTYGDGRQTELDRARANLSYHLGSELEISANAGSEANNYVTPSKTTTTTRGYGFRWVPSARTDVSFGQEKRFFGDARTVSVSHRTPRTVWKYSQNKDITVLPSQLTTIGLGNISDLLFSQMASIQPDPVLRAQEVADYLALAGIPADLPVTAGFLTSRVTVQKRQDLSVIITGARTTLTLLARQSDSEALSATVSSVVDDFSSSSTVRQRGLSVIVSHRVTPYTTLNLSGQRQINQGSGGVLQETTLRSSDIGINSRLTNTATGTLAVRRNLFESAVAPYRETVWMGALSLTF